MKIRSQHAVMFLAMGAAATLAHTACNPDPTPLLEALGGGCLLNSDCEGELVCVFRRCHQQCEQTPDCPIDSKGDPLRCMTGEPPVKVCQLEDEKYCGLNSDCPGEQVCGPTGECRDQCKTAKDCVTPQSCATGLCADSDEVDESTNRITAGGDSPPVGVGSACAINTDCCDRDGTNYLCNNGPAGQQLVCRGGQCTIECYLAVDCAAFQECHAADGSLDPPEGGNCVTPQYPLCIPGAQAACDCVDQSKGTQICDASGSGYGACVDAQGMSCAPP